MKFFKVFLMWVGFITITSIFGEYIISREDFKNLFETPEDLFCYLVSNQDMITFNKEG